MVNVVLFKDNKYAFSVNLSKRDARKFLKEFNGDIDYTFGNEDKYNVTITNIKNAVGYEIVAIEYRDKPGDALERAFDLMDGDLES